MHRHWQTDLELEAEVTQQILSLKSPHRLLVYLWYWHTWGTQLKDKTGFTSLYWVNWGKCLLQTRTRFTSCYSSGGDSNHRPHYLTSTPFYFTLHTTPLSNHNIPLSNHTISFWNQTPHSLPTSVHFLSPPLASRPSCLPPICSTVTHIFLCLSSIPRFCPIFSLIHQVMCSQWRDSGDREKLVQEFYNLIFTETLV